MDGLTRSEGLSNAFVKQLDNALAKIDLPVMRRVARVYRERIARTEHPEQERRRPLTGIYWWMPCFGKKRKLGWRVVAYHEFIYGDVPHAEIWRKYNVDELAAGLGLAHVAEEIKDLYASLPRGRVAQAMDGGYRIYHGKDEPPGHSVTAVQESFNFAEDGENKIEFDEHEQMIPDDYHRLVELVGVDLGMSPEL